MQQVTDKNLKKLGKRIKFLRKQKGYTLNGLVFSKGGISGATLSRIENGKCNVKFDTLLRISWLLEIKIDQLLKDIDFYYLFKE